jgi:hypothetical protein
LDRRIILGEEYAMHVTIDLETIDGPQNQISESILSQHPITDEFLHSESTGRVNHVQKHNGSNGGMDGHQKVHQNTCKKDVNLINQEVLDKWEILHSTTHS